MILEVIVDISNSEVDKIFDYSADFKVPMGSRVEVPFGKRNIEGFVIGTKESSEFSLKPIIKVLDEEVISEEMLELLSFLCKTYNLRKIDALRLFLPVGMRGDKIKRITKKLVALSQKKPFEEMLVELPKNAKSQRAMLIKLLDGAEYQSVLNGIFSQAVLNGLKERDFIEILDERVYRSPSNGLSVEKKDIVLTDEQKQAVDMILNGKNRKTLLHGVTGSGKTEIYMNAIEQIIAEGKTAIMLVPEISLTPQMLGLFRNRFKDEVAILHSGLSGGERYDEWQKLKEGKAKIALGARSAIFAPLKNIGLIVIDEEHDNSYISESNPRYATVDIANFRADYWNAKLVLGSATPSVETYYQAREGKYQIVQLDRRINKRELPKMEIIDMRKEIRSGNFSMFSTTLVSAITETLNRGNQAMIFLNRRGYASFVRCRSCGYIPRCPSCDVSLTYHKAENFNKKDTLNCHYCGSKYNMITECPICGNKNLKEGNTGTQKVVEELNRLFPSAKILRMDNDTTKKKGSCVEILTAFGSKEADILVGTQMIAKGHDFKDVTLVGILDADISLYFPDFKSAERTFQLITQVAGRAGRENKDGKVILQTYNPKHYVFYYSSAYDYKGFFDKEINTREGTHFPPFKKLIRILLQSQNESAVMEQTRIIYRKICLAKDECKGIEKLQMMQAPISKLNNYFRYQIILWLSVDKTEDCIKTIYEIVNNYGRKEVASFVETYPQLSM